MCGDAAVVGGRVPTSRIFADDARHVRSTCVDAPFYQCVRVEVSSDVQRAVFRHTQQSPTKADTPVFVLLSS